MIKYKASSGNEYDLYAQEMRVSEGNFHKYSWKPSSEKEWRKAKRVHKRSTKL